MEFFALSQNSESLITLLQYALEGKKGLYFHSWSAAKQLSSLLGQQNSKIPGMWTNTTNLATETKVVASVNGM